MRQLHSGRAAVEPVLVCAALIILLWAHSMFAVPLSAAAPGERQSQESHGTFAAESAPLAGWLRDERVAPAADQTWFDSAAQPAPASAAAPLSHHSPLVEAEPTDDWIETGLLDNLSIFGGLDGSKQPQDLGVNANMGGRVALNWGVPVVETWGLGAQLGVAWNFSDAAVQVLPRVEGTDERNQYYVTLGLFERTDWGLNVSGGYDFLWEDYYDRFQFGQWRGRVGYQFSEEDEAGVWFTIRDRGDSGSVLGIPVHLQPITQVNAFWRHTWETGGWTTLWIGAAQEHGKFVLVLPDLPPARTAFVYGADLHLPLNDWLALFGEANMITPPDSGTVDAYLGFVIYPGGGAREALGKRYLPLMPVAGNTSMAIDLSR